MSKIKRKVVLATLATASLTVVAFSSLLPHLNNNSSDSLSVSSVDTQAIGDGTSTGSITDTQISSFTVGSSTDFSWWGTVTAETITNEQLKSVLTPNVNANWSVIIQQPTSTQLAQGYVTFKVQQTITTYTGGVPTSSQVVEINPTDVNMSTWSGSTTDTTLWSTQNATELSGMIEAVKYSFSWNTDEEIAAFLESNTSSVTELGSNEDLLSQFVSGDSNLPDGTTLSVTVPTSPSGGEQYGVGLVTITFGDATQENWTDNSLPTGTTTTSSGTTTTGTLTRIFRGFQPTVTSNSNEVEVVNQSVSTIASATVSADAQTAIFGSSSATSTRTLSSYLPSQISSLSDSQLQQLFLNTDGQNYLTYGTSSTSTYPAVYFTYMGTDSTSTTFGSTTGLDSVDVYDSTTGWTTNVDMSTQIKVTGINAVADDLTGTLTLQFIYDNYDVFTNSIVTDQSLILEVTGLTTSSSAGSLDYMAWKDVDEVKTLYSSASAVSQAYGAATGDSAALTSLANSFLNASEAGYDLDKTLTVTVNGNDVTVTIGVDATSLGGVSWSATNTFTLDGSDVSATWSTQAQVEATITNWATLTPSDVATSISEGSISASTFVSTSASILFIPDDTIGSLRVTISDSSGNTVSRTYTGLSQTSVADQIYEFSWISNNDVSSTLLAKSLSSITVDDVINDYLSLIPYFSSHNLNSSNVSISANTDTQTLTISVTLSSYNQSSTTSSSRTFSTTIQGFIDYTTEDANSYVAPLDLTVVLSVTFAVVISVALISVLVWTIIRRKKISKISKKSFDGDKK